MEMVATGSAQELLAVPVTAASFAFLVRGVQILVNWDDFVACCLRPLAPNIPFVHFDCQLLDVFDSQVCEGFSVFGFSQLGEASYANQEGGLADSFLVGF